MASDIAYQRLAIRIFADFSGSIAIPSVLGALLGKWLDARYGTKPWLLIGCLAVAFLLTAIIVVKKARFYSKKYEALNQK